MPEEYKPNGPHARELGRISATLEALKEGVEGLHAEHATLRKELAEVKTQFSDFRQRMFVSGALVLGVGIGIGIMISPTLATALIKVAGF